jgi:hypothetical protein
MSDPQLGQATESAQQFILHGAPQVVNIARDEQTNVGALTAEDWEAARKSLGAGTRSILFGTSTKVLDAITRRFKEQAPAAVTPSQPDPEAGGPKGVGVTLFHHEVDEHGVESFERTEQSARPEPPTS